MASYDYTPFGEALPQYEGLANAFKFGGHREDESTGLLYMKARYYDPKLGRFLSADSIAPSLAQPQELNRYTYVLNNPVQYTDPSGNRACWPNGGCYATPDDPEWIHPGEPGWNETWDYEILGALQLPDGTFIYSYYIPYCDCSAVGDTLIDGRVSLSFSFDTMRPPEDRSDNPDAADAGWAPQVVAAAEDYLGAPYKYGGQCREEGIDCSGLIVEAFKAAGYEMTDRRAWALMEPGVSPFFERVEEPASGDMVGFGDSHVGLVVNPASGLMIHASYGAEKVKYERYNISWWGKNVGEPKFYRFSTEKYIEYRATGWK